MDVPEENISFSMPGATTLYALGRLATHKSAAAQAATAGGAHAAAVHAHGYMFCIYRKVEF
jgi:hypothetical protein